MNKTFFTEIFTPMRKPKVRIEYTNSIFVLIDDADQNLGYEFKNFNEAFRFAKSMGYEFSESDYFI
jgi:hypothetical protein